MDTAYLILPLLQGFAWFEEGLQNYLRLNGWPEVTRPQSLVMVAVLLGVTRPSDIARVLGVTRQAVHTTIAGMVEIDLLELADDPDDGRSKIAVVTERGRDMGERARQATIEMTSELSRRIGGDTLAGLRAALAADWGPPMDGFDPER